MKATKRESEGGRRRGGSRPCVRGEEQLTCPACAAVRQPFLPTTEGGGGAGEWGRRRSSACRRCRRRHRRRPPPPSPPPPPRPHPPPSPPLPPSFLRVVVTGQAASLPLPRLLQGLLKPSALKRHLRTHIAADASHELRHPLAVIENDRQNWRCDGAGRLNRIDIRCSKFRKRPNA